MPRATRPEEWLECGAWPPPEGDRWDLFLAPGHVGLRSEPASGAGAAGADTSAEPLSYSYDPRETGGAGAAAWFGGSFGQGGVQRAQNMAQSI